MNQMDLADAALILQLATELDGAEEYELETADVLPLSKESKCSAYGCEYVALAEFLDLILLTTGLNFLFAAPGALDYSMLALRTSSAV